MIQSQPFPTKKYGYKVKKDIPLSPSKYLNQRLIFVSDSDTFSNGKNSIEQSNQYWYEEIYFK